MNKITIRFMIYVVHCLNLLILRTQNNNHLRLTDHDNITADIMEDLISELNKSPDNKKDKTTK